MSKARRGLANVTKMVSGHLATAVILVVSGFVIPRTFGVEVYGQYSALLAVLAMLQTLSSLGLQQVEVRYLSPLCRERDPDAAISLGSSILSLRLALSGVVGILAVLWIAGTPRLAVEAQGAMLLGVLCAFRSAHQAARSLLLPLGHVGKLAGFELFRAVSTLLLVIAVFPSHGLSGVFAGLAWLYVLLFVLSVAMVLRILPLRPARFRWNSISPYLPYSLASFAGMGATVVHAQFSVFAVAAWVTRREAGILAVAVQVYTLSRGLFLAARRSLMPILAEMEAAGEKEGLERWGGIMMRYGAALTSAATLCWAFVGESAIRWLLTDAYLPVYPCATLIFVGVTFYVCGASCVGLLYTRGLAGIASTMNVIYALAAAVGLIFVLRDGNAGSAYRISWVYALAAAVYWASAHRALGTLGGLRLPVGPPLALILPVAAAWPVSAWDAPFPAKALALVAALAAYGAMAISSRLLPVEEIRGIFQTLWPKRRRGTIRST